MRFDPLGDSDARLVHVDGITDDRGSFYRTWCADSFARAGIDFTPIQGNISRTRQRYTVRGMHFQRPPHADAKIVRCTAGRIHDVIVDLRVDSPALGQAYATELTAIDCVMLFVPAGFAHGFQTLTDDVDVEYLMGERYLPDFYDGFRHDDPCAGITWPHPVSIVSERDRLWPDLQPRIMHAAPVR